MRKQPIKLKKSGQMPVGLAPRGFHIVTTNSKDNHRVLYECPYTCEYYLGRSPNLEPQTGITFYLVRASDQLTASLLFFSESSIGTRRSPAFLMVLDSLNREMQVRYGPTKLLSPHSRQKSIDFE